MGITAFGSLHAATFTSNNTGIAPAAFTFVDNDVASSTLTAPSGTDGDAQTFGIHGYWAAGGTVTYSFTGLVPNRSYNIYATWYTNTASLTVGIDVTANATFVKSVVQGTAPASPAGANEPKTTSGFTASDATPGAAEPFELLGTGVTDGSGNLTIVAIKTPTSAFARWDAMAVAPTPLTLHWDGNASTANSISENTATTGTNWISGGNWDNGATSAPMATWTAGDSAVFGGGMAGTQTVSLSSPLSIGGLTFNTDGYSIAGGSITLEASSHIVTANANGTIASVIEGTGGLVKNGPSTLTLTGANTQTGNISVNAGTLALGAGGSLDTVATRTISVAAGATFAAGTFTQPFEQTLTGTGTVSGAITSEGILVPGTAGAGTLSIPNLSLSSAVLEIKPGATQISTTTLSTAGFNSINIGIAPIAPGNYPLITYTGSIGGSGLGGLGLGTTPGGAFLYNLTASGGSVNLVVESAAALWTGSKSSEWSLNAIGAPKNWTKLGVATDYVNGDDVKFDDTASSVVVDISQGNVSPFSMVFDNTSKDFSIAGTSVITGDSDLVKGGAGKLTLQGNHEFTGPVTINAGIVEVGQIADGGLPSPLGASLSGSNSLLLAGGTLSYTGGDVTSDRAFGLGAATTSTIAVTTPAATLSLTGASNSSDGALTKTGPGTLRLTARNLYTGATRVEGGTLELNRTVPASGLSTVSPLTIDNATVRLTGDQFNILGGNPTIVRNGGVLIADCTVDNAHNIGGAVGITLDGGTLDSGPVDTEYGNFVVGPAGLTVTGTALSSIICEGLGLDGVSRTFTVADVTAGTDLLVTAAIKNNGIYSISALVKEGSGTLRMEGDSSYSGNTVVNAGTLELADNASITLVLGIASGTSSKLTGAGNVVLDGDFVIDTTAANALTTGTWILEDATTLPGAYGASFTVEGFADAGGNLWTKTDGTKLWSFDETSGTLTLGAGNSNFASWATANGVTGGANGDSDNDGILNLVEYGLNLNPAASDGSAGTFSGNLLSFAKRAEAVTNGDLTYAIQESDDLGQVDPWTAVTPTTNDATTISYQLPTGGSKKFARLLIQQNQ